MKIAKGHYVPKELIASEAVHEAVVKVFVAAGFKDRSPMYGNFKRMESFAGLSVDNQGEISWGDKGSSAKETLTLQQLFTAENGLQWPDWAVDIRTDDHCVWFDGIGMADVISGDWSPVKSRILATLQPNALIQSQTLTHSEEGLTHSEWWDYENHCIIDEQCPPIGSIVELRERTEFLSLASGEITFISAGAHCHVVGHAERPDNNFKCVTLMSVINVGAGFCTGNPTRLVRPLDHATRKADLERKRVVDAAVSAAQNFDNARSVSEVLYDAGMLVMPK